MPFSRGIWIHQDYVGSVNVKSFDRRDTIFSFCDQLDVRDLLQSKGDAVANHRMIVGAKHADGFARPHNPLHGVQPTLLRTLVFLWYLLLSFYSSDRHVFTPSSRVQEDLSLSRLPHG
jgi:hypothetical protein